MRNLIQGELQKQIEILHKIQQDKELLSVIEKIAECCIGALRRGNKILFAGNGGSAADAQHLAAELVGRLRYDRPGLAAIALTTDTSALTAIGNDLGFEEIFSRQIESLGREGDVFIGISTSGKSPNILKALNVARDLHLTTIGFTGAKSPLLSQHSDFVLNIPATDVSKIQECHIMFGHIICALVENAIYGAEFDPMLQSA